MKEIKELLHLVKSNIPDERRQGAQGLGDFDDELTVKILVELLKDDDAGVKDAAFNSLLKIGNSVVVEETIKILKSGSMDLNAVAIEILTITGENHVELLISLLASHDAELKETVLDILGNTSLSDNKDKICSAIKGFLDDEDSNVRFAAAEVMGKLPCWQCAEDLAQRFKKEENQWVKYAIVESLMSIKGEDYKIDNKTLKDIAEELG